MRRGITVVELLAVLAMIGLLLVLGLPTVSQWMDRLATERAALELASFYNRGRFAAIFRSTRVRLEFAPDSLRAVFEGVTDSVFLRWPGPARHGVRFTASRPVIRIHPTGIGWGAANTKLVVRRGAAADSLTTSRIGRLKRWH